MTVHKDQEKIQGLLESIKKKMNDTRVNFGEHGDMTLWDFAAISLTL